MKGLATSSRLVSSPAKVGGLPKHIHLETVDPARLAAPDVLGAPVGPAKPAGGARDRDLDGVADAPLGDRLDQLGGFLSRGLGQRAGIVASHAHARPSGMPRFRAVANLSRELGSTGSFPAFVASLHVASPLTALPGRSFPQAPAADCGRPSDDTPVLPFGRPILSRASSVLPRSAREDGVSLLRCVRGGWSWSKHRRSRWRRHLKSGAAHCTAVQSIAPQFTPAPRAASGLERPHSIGPRPPASKSAWRNTGWPGTRCPTPASSRSSGCLIDPRHGRAENPSCSGLTHFHLPQAHPRRDQSAEASRAPRIDRIPDHRSTEVSACARAAVAAGADRDLVSAGSRLYRRSPHAIRLTHHRRPLSHRRDHGQPARISIPAPRGLSGAEHV